MQKSKILNTVIFLFLILSCLFPQSSLAQENNPDQYNDQSEQIKITNSDTINDQIKYNDTLEEDEQDISDVDAEIESENNEDNVIEGEYLDISVLDKQTSKRQTYTIYPDKPIQHYGIEIHLKRCLINIHPINQDVLGFFEIYQIEKTKKRLIFANWISKNNYFIENIEKSYVLITILKCHIR